MNQYFFPNGNITPEKSLFSLVIPEREYYTSDMIRIGTITDLSDLIRKRRKELDLTQAEAAGLCGVGVRFWSEMENGKESLHIGKVITILTRLGIALQADVAP